MYTKYCLHHCTTLIKELFTTVLTYIITQRIVSLSHCDTFLTFYFKDRCVSTNTSAESLLRRDRINIPSRNQVRSGVLLSRFHSRWAELRLIARVTTAVIILLFRLFRLGTSYVRLSFRKVQGNRCQPSVPEFETDELSGSIEFLFCSNRNKTNQNWPYNKTLNRFNFEQKGIQSIVLDSMFDGLRES